MSLVFKLLVETICKHSDITMIYVSHFQEEIPDSLTYVLALEGGKVVEKGTLR